MHKFQINCPLSLSRFSAMKISKLLWSQPDLKHLILCIKEYNIWSFTIESTDSKDILHAQLSHKIDKLILPKPVEQELRFVVASMGTRISAWIYEMKRHGNSSVDLALYIDHIRWTDNGCVDACKTLESMYLTKALPEDIVTWMVLCKHCLEHCINDLWPEVLEIENRMSSFRPVMVMYWCYRMQNRSKGQLERLMTILSGYNKEYSLEENMFEYAFIGGNYSALEYFWRLLNNDERKRIIIHVSNMLINDINLLLHPDVVNFLLQQLYFYELNHLLSKLLALNHVLIQLLQWPHQDLFMMGVENSWMHDLTINYTSVILEIFRCINNSFLTVGGDFHYREIFYEIWEIIIAERKTSVDFLVVLKELWQMKDIELLNYVINDAHMKEMRHFHLFYILQLFEHTTYSDNITLFAEEFMSKILVSEEERGPFRCYVEDIHLKM